MNTRGLTELIVLNLALEKGVITDALFAMLVIMALVTTFMAGPLLKLLDPQERVRRAARGGARRGARAVAASEFPELPVPERSILVAPADRRALGQLLALAEPLARSEPPRELIVARLVRPPGAARPSAAACRPRTCCCSEATRARSTSARASWPTRRSPPAASRSRRREPGRRPRPARRARGVDLLLIEGRRPLLGEGVPLGDVGDRARDAPCDVAVLVAREGDPIEPGPERPGARAVRRRRARLGGARAGRLDRVVHGRAAQAARGRRPDRRGQVASRGCSADAGLLVQQYAGIADRAAGRRPAAGRHPRGRGGRGTAGTRPVRPLAAEGLGPTRSEIAGGRSGAGPLRAPRYPARAVAPQENVTRFRWSMAGGPSGLLGSTRGQSSATTPTTDGLWGGAADLGVVSENVKGLSAVANAAAAGRRSRR